jgi:hypothetical protein
MHQFICQCIPSYCVSPLALKCVCLRTNTISSLRVVFILRRPCCAPFMCSTHWLAVCPLDSLNKRPKLKFIGLQNITS